MARLGSRLLTLTLDGTDVTAQVTSAKVTSNDAKAGEVSFAEAAAGGSKEYALVIKFWQDPSVDSVWDKVWTAAGSTVPVVLHPNGGTPSASNPVITGDVVISEPSGDLLGGDASSDSSVRWVTECTWVYVAKPVRTFA